MRRLSFNPARPDKQTKLTALMQACTQGNTDTAIMLIDKGANTVLQNKVCV